MKKVWLVATREYLATVRRKGFIITTLGMPLFFMAIIGVSALSQYWAFRSARSNDELVGIVDEAGVLNVDLLSKVQQGTSTDSPPSLQSVPPQLREQAQQEIKRVAPQLQFKIFPGKQQAQAALTAGQLRAFYRLPLDYLERGEVELEVRKGGFFSDSRPGWALLQRWIAASLVNGRLEQRLGERLWRQPQLKAVTWTDTGQRDNRGRLSEISDFAVPYTFSLLFLMSILTSAGYLLQSVAEEKENRVIEILLSSLRADQLLAGKVIGLCAAGLTQLAVWIVVGVTPAVWALPFVRVRPSLLLVALLFFVLGFLLFGTLMGGFGSLGNNVKESQQMSLVWTMSSVVPLFFLTLILAQPNGTFARVLSYIPLTAPVTIMLRTSATHVPWWDVALSALILLASLFLFIRLAAKVFRLGILMYGKRPTFMEIWKWLRAA